MIRPEWAAARRMPASVLLDTQIHFIPSEFSGDTAGCTDNLEAEPVESNGWRLTNLVMLGGSTWQYGDRWLEGRGRTGGRWLWAQTQFVLLIDSPM